MFFSAAAAAALFTLGANARITGFGCPETVVPGRPFKAVIITDKFEEIVTDVSISFGYGDRGYKGTGDYGHGHGHGGDYNRVNDYSPHNLGGYLDSYYLNERYEKSERFEREVIIPENTHYGDGRISASLYSLYGEDYHPEVHDFFVDVKFAEEISDKYVYSHY